MGVEASRASKHDRDKEEPKFFNMELEELQKIAAAYHMSVEDYQAWYFEQTGTNISFTTYEAELNPRNTTSKKMRSGKRVDTTRWNADWAAADQLGKARRKGD